LHTDYISCVNIVGGIIHFLRRKTSVCEGQVRHFLVFWFDLVWKKVNRSWPYQYEVRHRQ